MTKIPESETSIELLVNCKTYPAVSRKYTETVCTGGVQSTGEFVRLYPVPFRFLSPDEQYDRWDVIKVRAYRDTKDTRPESWHFVPGSSIEKLRHIASEKQRWEWMCKTIHDSAEAMSENGLTNGCVEIEPIELYWKPDNKEWTASQKQTINQGDLFATPSQLRGLAESIPWQFRLKYREKSTGREDEGKVLAWSYYTGYLRNKLRCGDDEQALEEVADKVRSSIFNRDRTVFAILGTHSRFGNWMISALYHVPTAIITAANSRGGCLF